MSDARPSFSLVLETANLGREADVTDLFRALDSIAAQDLHPREAREVLLVQTSALPHGTAERVRERYPWVTIVRAPSGTGYYASKMVGAQRATGEIVVFCDSDCRYDPGWLRALLAPLRRPEVQVVAGNAGLDITGPFTFALSLIWCFPMISRSSRRSPISYYAANNVAFRRAVLEACPLPSDAPVYRGNCSLHSRRLRQSGYPIHFARDARNIHPAPATRPTVFFWRFLVSGHDWLVWHRLSPAHQDGLRGALQDLVAFLLAALRWAARVLVKLPGLVAEAPQRLLWVPIALPLAGVAWVLFCAGFLISACQPALIMAAGVPRLER